MTQYKSKGYVANDCIVHHIFIKLLCADDGRGETISKWEIILVLVIITIIAIDNKFNGGMGMGMGMGYSPIKCYCMNCGYEHKENTCPKCGSKAVRVA